jgi:hypothetical protein
MARDAAIATIAVQCAGALCGMLAAHLMFDEALFQLSIVSARRNGSLNGSPPSGW